MSDFEQWCRRWGCSGQALTELQAILSPERFTQRMADPSTSESAVQNDVRLLAPRQGGAMWRNNNGAFKDDAGRWVRYGLGNDSKPLNEKWKSSDLIGITKVKATYVGQEFGVFTAAEIKTPGWKLLPSDKRGHAQSNFMNTVSTLGGIAGFVQDVRDFERMLAHAKGQA